MFLKTTGLNAGINDAKGAFAMFGASVGNNLKSIIVRAIGPAALAYTAKQSVTGVIEAISAALDKAKSLHDLADNYDMTAEEIQRMDKAARQNGKTLEDMLQAETHLASARQQAIEGNEELRSQFRLYGVQLSDLINPQERNIDLMQRMSVAMGKINLTPQQRNDLKEIFGKQAGSLFPAISAFGGKQNGPLDLTNQETQTLNEIGQFIENLFEEAKKLIPKAIAQTIESNQRGQAGILPSPTLFASAMRAAGGLAGAVPGIGGLLGMPLSLIGRGVETLASIRPEPEIQGPPLPPVYEQSLKDVQELNKLYEKGKSILMDQMSVREKTMYMEREIAALEIAKENATQSELPGLNHQIDVKRLEIQNFLAGQGKDRNTHGFEKINVNSLQQIGAYSGADPVVRTLTESLNTQKRTEQNTRKIADNTRTTSDSF